MERDRRGLYYVVDKNTAAREVFVFSPDGRYMRSIGGRRGEGPGEHRFISQLFVMPGDSLRLHDVALGRYTVIDPEHEFVRTERYAPVGYLATLLLSDGRMITNGSRIPGLSIREARGKPNLPIHIIDAKGAHVRSFGLERVDTMPTRNTVHRSLALAPDGRLYVGHSQAYVIEVWDTLGVKHRELVRDAEWFRPWEDQPALATRLPRHPYLEALGLDNEGRVWTLSMAMQDGWERHIETAPPRDGEPNGRSILGGVTKNDVHDTIVEVIDPVTGQLIVSQRFDLWIYRLMEDGLVVTDGEDENLVSYVDIWRLRLLEPS